MSDRRRRLPGSGSLMLRRLLRFARSPSRRAAARIIADADAARDTRRFRDAAVLYEQALAFAPGRAGIHVQAGHMFKESADLPAAERHYRHALALTPDDPDLALQLGHFFKVAGRIGDAAESYRKALTLAPDWPEPARELAALRARWGDMGDAREPGPNAASPSDERVVPELLPGHTPAPFHAVDAIELRRLGGPPQRTPWGLMSTLRGIEAVRGFCVSDREVAQIELTLDGAVLQTVSPFVHDLTGGRCKFVFNIWQDLSTASTGLHRLELIARDAEGRPVARHGEQVVIGAPLREADHPGSDGVVEIDADDGRTLEEQVRARRSMVRTARRPLFPAPPRNVAVLRTDQLGDLVVSIPALRRLRALLPDARLVGLLTAANVDLARSLDLFDEVVVVDFPDVLSERRRVMTRERQIELRERLAPYRFDIALDLAPSFMSRPLLLLTGARFLYGFEGGDAPWLSAHFGGNTPDAWNGHETSAESGKLVAFVDRLGSMLSSDAPVIPRPHPTPDMLATLGIGAEARYIVLHTGARIAFSRWPGYAALAGMLLERTDLQVVILSEGPFVLDGMDAALAASDRLIVLDRRLDFELFDALIAGSAVFVGNDSGPKHLASLRGVPTLSLHSARINWNDWGQEQTGLIVSRRVPCAGCALYHDVEECGKGYACIADIRVEEVFEAVETLLAGDLP